jgi:hypothetical protein
MILQADNREFAKLYSMRSETVTESMYDIAKTTERDTSSMHVITLFTLLFLPGTFLAVRHIKSHIGWVRLCITNEHTELLQYPNL